MARIDLAQTSPESSADALPNDIRQTIQTLTVIAMDVDGVVTDAGRTYGLPESDGLVFNVRDGLGLALLVRAGLRVVWISARESAVIERRAKDLRITDVHLGVSTKSAIIETLRASTAGTVAFIGDDIWDVAAFGAADVSFAVRNAHWRAAREAMIITTLDGGRGAVREIADLVLSVKGIDPVDLLADLDGEPDLSVHETAARKARSGIPPE